MTLDPETKARIEAEEAYRAQVRRRKGSPAAWKWAAALVGVPVAVALFFAAWGSLSPAAADPKTDFLVACQRNVRDSMKAPSTAKFGNEISRDVMTVASGYQLVGTVEAQNSFGALLESSYLCRGTVGSLKVEID